MKKKYLLAFILLITIVCACTNDREVNECKATNEMVATGELLATIHNECLADIYDSLSTQVKTRAFNMNSSDFDASIVSLAKGYISRHLPNTRTSEQETDFSILNMSPLDIANNLSEKELEYINKTTEFDYNKEILLEELLSDDSLDIKHKKAVICFITTFFASSEYWKLNIDKWEKLFGQEKTRASFRWRDAAVADAFYGYQGMLFSGFNIYVAGGAAAAGSVLSGLR